jgi:hypothetical protein
LHYVALLTGSVSEGSSTIGRMHEFFDDDRLWAELERPEGERKRSALRAVDALAELAWLRARADGEPFVIVRRTIYDWDLLRADLHGTHGGELRDAALRAWEEVNHLVALREAEDGAATDEVRQCARELVDWVRDRLEDVPRAAGFPERAWD